jgi:hypothetical protein
MRNVYVRLKNDTPDAYRVYLWVARILGEHATNNVPVYRQFPVMNPIIGLTKTGWYFHTYDKRNCDPRAQEMSVEDFVGLYHERLKNGTYHEYEGYLLCSDLERLLAKSVTTKEHDNAQ